MAPTDPGGGAPVATTASHPATLSLGIVHEWLTNRAGSERCVEAVADLFPDHRIYTSMYRPQVFPTIDPAAVTAVLPGRGLFDTDNGHVRGAPLLPLAMRRLRVERHDAVFCSFHHFATQVRVPEGVPTLVYLYTPPRFIHRRESMANERQRVVRFATRLGRLVEPIDRRALHRRTTRLVAISTAVAARAEAAYGVRPEVIHPPVDLETWHPDRSVERGDRFLLVGRLVPYKRPDLAIEAFRDLPHLHLDVIGDGRMAAELRATAPPNVHFHGRVDDAELLDRYRRARALLFPAEEDYGMVPVEAMATGCPVIAFARGGVIDYLVPGLNGVGFDDQSVASLRRAIQDLADLDTDPSAVAESVAHLDRRSFQAAIGDAVSSMVAGRIRS